MAEEANSENSSDSVESVRRSELVKFRPFDAFDRNYIYDNWINGNFYGNPILKESADLNRYKSFQQRVIDFIFREVTVKVNIACLTDDATTIIGYAITRSHTLDWVYVRESWRRLGIARDLLRPQTLTRRSHTTRMSSKIHLITDKILDPIYL